MDESIPLILDSSVFRQVPKLNSQLFKEIVKYTRVGIYKLYIPEIVEKEYISWIKGEAQGSYDNVVKTTQLLHKYYESPKILGLDFTFSATASVAASEINGILKKVIDNWHNFKVNTGASIIPILPEHGKLVMDAYFDGAKPFDKIKNRVDIPDAFIYFGIQEILKVSDKVVFVTGDKRFSEKVQDENIVCFGSLSDLFSFGPAKLGQYFNHLNSNDRGKILLNMHKEYILNKLASDIAISELTDIFSEDLIGFTIGKYHDYSIDVNNLNYLIGGIKDISNSSLLVPFSANIICSIKSTASKVELSSVETQRLAKIEREVDDEGEFNLCEKYESHISGHFSVTFQDGDPSTWKEEKSSDSFFSEQVIKEINVTLEDLQASA